MSDCKENLTIASSHLHKANGWELEHISFRIVGRVLVRYKRTFGWTKWRERWMELHDQKIVFYQWSRKREHYDRVTYFFNDLNKQYVLEGVSCKDKMYIFTITLDGRRMFMIKNPHSTALSLLYPELNDRLK